VPLISISHIIGNRLDLNQVCTANLASELLSGNADATSTNILNPSHERRSVFPEHSSSAPEVRTPLARRRSSRTTSPVAKIRQKLTLGITV
jgi:hypothetical protein